MNITLDEFLVLAKKYQALGSSSQLLLDDLRSGNPRVQDGVRLRQLYEFMLDLQYVQDGRNEIHDLSAAVSHLLAESKDEEEEKVVAERWIPEKGFPGATLWLQREDEKWAVAPTSKEGACLGKCIKDLSVSTWFEKPLPLLVDRNH